MSRLKKLQLQGVTPSKNTKSKWEDILCKGLSIVFVGYNPSIPAWRTGHYYANPGNRFYRLLFDTGLTPRLLTPQEDRLLPIFHIGATDLLPEPSARASQVSPQKFREAVPALFEKIKKFQPKAVCFNGVGVYRYVFEEKPPRWGYVPSKKIENTKVFVVPSTSGLANAFTAQRLEAFRELAAWHLHGKFLKNTDKEP